MVFGRLCHGDAAADACPSCPGFVIIFAFFFVHLYLVTIGAPGSAPAMFTGWVTRGWVKTQHPKWLKEMEKDGTLIVYGEKKGAVKKHEK